jgi:hypothetical protein
MRRIGTGAMLVALAVIPNLAGCPGNTALLGSADSSGGTAVQTFDSWTGNGDENPPSAQPESTETAVKGIEVVSNGGTNYLPPGVLQDNVQYDATRSFRLRDALVVTATTDLTLTIQGAPAAVAELDRVGGLHVLQRTANAPPARWFTVQRLLSAVTRFRLPPGQYRIGPPAEYFSGGGSGVTAQVTCSAPAVTLVSYTAVDPGQQDTLSEQIPEIVILSNVVVMPQLLTNLRGAPSDYTNFYAPLGFKIALTTCRLTASPAEFAESLPIAAAQMAEMRELGVPAVLCSGVFTASNTYGQWFDRATWERITANFLLAVETLGIQEYALDFEPYWEGTPRYPAAGPQTWNCWAAMQPLIEAVRARSIRVYAIPGSGFAPCDALSLGAPQTVMCSEFGYLVSSLPDPTDASWEYVDSELGGAASVGRKALSGFYSGALRSPVPAFRDGMRARGINQYWLYPYDDDTAWAAFRDHFFTRTWFAD